MSGDRLILEYALVGVIALIQLADLDEEQVQKHIRNKEKIMKMIDEMEGIENE